MFRKITAELLGTGLLVYFGVGVAPCRSDSARRGSVMPPESSRRLSRSALIVGGTALSQVWLFIVAPLVGGAVAAGLHRILYPEPPVEPLASGEIPTPEEV
jgi:glycerol uptake facilitator-like aquaporin